MICLRVRERKKEQEDQEPHASNVPSLPARCCLYDGGAEEEATGQARLGISPGWNTPQTRLIVPGESTVSDEAQRALYELVILVSVVLIIAVAAVFDCRGSPGQEDFGAATGVVGLNELQLFPARCGEYEGVILVAFNRGIARGTGHICR